MAVQYENVLQYADFLFTSKTGRVQKGMAELYCVVSPDYPAASNEDYLFDCMNLYARLKEDGQVIVEGVVFYWNPVDGDTQKSAVIRAFKDIDECLGWISNESAAKEECVEVLNENC